MRLLFPRHLSIETSDACNRSCTWCPVQRDALKGPPRLLDWQLYLRLLDELRDAPRPLKVTLQWIDEPLMNPRLLDYADEGRRRAPDVTWLLQTNGDLLTPQSWSALGERFDAIAVNLYSASAHRRLSRLGIAPPPAARRPHQSPGRVAREGTRGAAIFNEKYHDVDWVQRRDEVLAPSTRRCARPWTQATVGFDGAVHVCCRDNLKQHPVGSLQTTSLFEAYNGERAQALRWLLSRGHRRAIAMCSTCPVSFGGDPRHLTRTQQAKLAQHARAANEPNTRPTLNQARATQLAAPDMSHARDDSPERLAQLRAVSHAVVGRKTAISP
ncbi:MAG: radical SAM/SPASM domain-containing protein [Myxococcales bacterium]|nr:radical SAM/SPASM domain-containing protein [Myxococcales bacterium]MDP3501065.1 radical SAM/SPASM domain-containing protein [Myxococcales bacterium]